VGKAEARLKTPAETLTATVSTGRGDQPGELAEVRMGDDVAPAAIGIRPDRLSVGQRDQHEQAQNHAHDRHEPGKRDCSGREERIHRRLGAVGYRRHCVRAEDRQRLPLRQTLGDVGLRSERLPEENASNPRQRPAERRRGFLCRELRPEHPGGLIAEVAGVGSFDPDATVTWLAARQHRAELAHVLATGGALLTATRLRRAVGWDGADRRLTAGRRPINGR
jgi:hypothetical protein